MTLGTGYRRHVVAIALCAGVLVAGCADSGYQYVTNKDQGAYFKVPDGWELFDLADEEERDAPPDRAEAVDLGGPEPWRIVFDAAPDPSVDHLREASPEHPVGIAEVAPITTRAIRDGVDLAALRAMALGGQADPVALLEQGDPNIELVSFEDITTEDGFRGNHIVVNLKLEDGSFRTIDHIALLDAATTRMYRFVVTCSAACYLENRAEIERIMDSWQIRKG
jgi:hypothetical protein